MRRAVRIAAALAIGVAGVACDELGAALEPSPTLPGDGGSPRPEPPPALRRGRALLRIRGDADASFVFRALTEPAIYAGGEGTVSLVWRTAAYDLFTLGGDLRVGAQPTSETLRLQLALAIDGDVVGFTSDDGRCTVTVERADVGGLDGRVRCVDLASTDGALVVDASGTFRASARGG